MMQNGYAYRFCDIALNAETEYKRNIDLIYSLNAYEMRVNVREYQKDNQKFEINFANHEIFFKIKTGYKQTDKDGVNTQYQSNKKQKMGTYAVNIYGWLICKFTVPQRTIEIKTNMQYIFKIICILQSLYTGRKILKG
jgi:hypothetical protein